MKTTKNEDFVVLPLLDCHVFKPAATLADSNVAGRDRSPKLTLNEAGVEATAYEVEGRFVVARGSTARRKGSASWNSYLGLREELVAERKLTEKDESLYEFACDVEFASPSAAAAVVMAANRNGRTSWRLEDGRTYAQWKQAQLDSAADL